MARIRQIKPEFYLDDELARCPRDARLMFPGLWCLADRAGRLEDRPARIKAQLFPYDDDITVQDIEGLLDVLAEHFILRYSVAGKHYIQIRNFVKHQHIHMKEVPSEIPPVPSSPVPEPDEPGANPGKYGASTVQDGCKTGTRTVLPQVQQNQLSGKTGAKPVQEPDEHRSSRLGFTSTSTSGELGFGLGGGMGEGSKPPPSAAASKRLRRETNKPPPTLPELLTDQMLEWCELAAPNIDPKIEAEKFLDYHLGQGTTLADWSATFRGWIRIAIERAKQSARGPTRRESVEEHNRRVFAELEAMDETAIRVMQGLDPDRGSG